MKFSNDKEFYSKLLRLTIPIFLQNLLRVSVDTFNSIMLGSIDQIQMSAISQANQIFFVFYTICNGISAGCCVLVAQHWGKRDYDNIATIIAHALRTVAVFALVISSLVFLFPETFMRIYSSDPEIVMVGAQHLRRICFMYVACGLSVVIFGACRGVEQVRIILITNIVSYTINILLDYVSDLRKISDDSEGTAIKAGDSMGRDQREKLATSHGFKTYREYEKHLEISAGISASLNEKCKQLTNDALWLYEKFGDGVYADVLGLCKLATLAEIEEKGWSLTPGAYVGVAPIEDDGIDFATRMAEIHRVLLSLQAESNYLMGTISQNMKEMGI